MTKIEQNVQPWFHGSDGKYDLSGEMYALSNHCLVKQKSGQKNTSVSSSSLIFQSFTNGLSCQKGKEHENLVVLKQEGGEEGWNVDKNTEVANIAVPFLLLQCKLKRRVAKVKDSCDHEPETFL